VGISCSTNLSTYSFSGDKGKCNVGLAILEGFDGSMTVGDFFGQFGEAGFARAAPVGEYFCPLGSVGD
jgi:hypothetical protein